MIAEEGIEVEGDHPSQMAGGEANQYFEHSLLARAENEFIATYNVTRIFFKKGGAVAT